MRNVSDTLDERNITNTALTRTAYRVAYVIAFPIYFVRYAIKAALSSK
jgi:hypothetical protein